MSKRKKTKPIKNAVAEAQWSPPARDFEIDGTPTEFLVRVHRADNGLVLEGRMNVDDSVTLYSNSPATYGPRRFMKILVDGDPRAMADAIAEIYVKCTLGR